jgi:hypothetical protein
MIRAFGAHGQQRTFKSSVLSKRKTPGRLPGALLSEWCRGLSVELVVETSRAQVGRRGKSIQGQKKRTPKEKSRPIAARPAPVLSRQTISQWR